MSTPISRSSPRRKMISAAARDAAMISASVDERAMECWPAACSHTQPQRCHILRTILWSSAPYTNRCR
eukprot:1677393-Prymnesium_polylepis.2